MWLARFAMCDGWTISPVAIPARWTAARESLPDRFQDDHRGSARYTVAMPARKSYAPLPRESVLEATMPTVAVIYRPRHQRQLVSSDPHGKDNCTAYCAAMLMDAATFGGMVVTGRTVRALSSEPTPDPASPGLNIRQIVAVSKKLRVPLVDFTGNTTSYARSLMGSPTVAGRRLMLQVDYGAMGAWRAPGSTFAGGHAVNVYAVRDRPGMDDAALTGDPLRTGLVWIPWRVIEAAALAFARQTGVTAAGAIRFCGTRRVPFIAA